MDRLRALKAAADGAAKKTADAKQHHAEVLAWQQIAEALEAAHEQGIIHRDLKPANLMIGDYGEVLVMDWGLARVLGAKERDAPTAVTSARRDLSYCYGTIEGVLLGTPQYMSPEACESKRDIDQRTDIYAVGVLLFQMLTGKLPFDGSSMGEVLVKQVTQLPPAPRGIRRAMFSCNVRLQSSAKRCAPVMPAGSARMVSTWPPPCSRAA